MCDPSMLWLWEKSGVLETWTFSSSPGSRVESWQQCFLDQTETFQSKNYTFSAAGGWERKVF